MCQGIIRNTFSTLKLASSKLILPLSTINRSIQKKDNVVAAIDSNLLFQTMNVIKNSDK